MVKMQKINERTIDKAPLRNALGFRY